MSLRVFLFGSVRAIHDLSPCEVKMTRAVQSLLAYLVLHGNRPHPREVLAEVFWGDSAEKQARGSLSTALWRLRSVLEPRGIPRGTYLLTDPPGTIGFNGANDHWVDVEVLEEAVIGVMNLPVQVMNAEDARKLEAALDLYKGELLEGLYADWAVRERERLRLLNLKGLVHLMRYKKHVNRSEEGLACAHRVLALDPLREEIHREVMRFYAASGQRTLAVQQYRACCSILDRELGISPMEETRQLFSRIARGGALDAPESPAIEALRHVDDGQNVTLDQVLQGIHLAMECAERVHKDLQLAIQVLERLTTKRRSEPLQ